MRYREFAMTLRIVRLGTARLPQEGTRIGTVRRLPRGVRKERYAADDWFDVWYPDLSPSAGLVAQARAAATDAEWDTFVRARSEEHTSELQSLMRISYAVFCLKKKQKNRTNA